MNRVIRPEHPETYPIVKGEVSSLCISDLTATQRSELWLHIQAHHPDKAKELKILHEDKEFQSLKYCFRAGPGVLSKRKHTYNRARDQPIPAK